MDRWSDGQMVRGSEVRWSDVVYVGCTTTPNSQIQRPAGGRPNCQKPSNFRFPKTNPYKQHVIQFNST